MGYLYRMALCALLPAFSLQLAAQPRTWKEASACRDSRWWASARARAVADSILKYQLPDGGWTKNEDWLDGSAHLSWQKAVDTGVGTTIDNGATWKEIRFLARVAQTMDTATVSSERKALIAGVERGLCLLLRYQYPNGGFPQFLPPKRGDYSRHITFNDGAMLGVLRLLRDVAEARPPFDRCSLSDSLTTRCREAFERGIDCILRCQIRDAGGRLTVWCQQHDEQTLLPAGARAYELPSYCAGSETADLLQFLMELPNPTDQVYTAVVSAMTWLEEHALHDKYLQRFTNADSLPDRQLIDSIGAPLLWARFYDLDKGQPFVCDRDGRPKRSLSDIGYERRNGYAWYGSQPLLLFHLYDEWKRIHQTDSLSSPYHVD